MSSSIEDLDRDLRAFFALGMDAPCDDASFNGLALRVFAFQFEALAAYRAYCQRRGALPARLRHWSEVPAVPVQAFKDVRLACDDGTPPARVFRTSGTTDAGHPGEHYMSQAGLQLYDASLVAMFRAFVLPDVAARARARLVPLVLGPPPAETPHSSLFHMIEVAGRECFETLPRYFLPAGVLDAAGLFHALERAAAGGRGALPVCLLGTDLALVRLLDEAAEAEFRVALPAGSRLVHTGGSKGRGREIARAELHARVGETLGLKPAWCVNEYGMTEMASQFYETGLRRAAGAAAGAGTGGRGGARSTAGAGSPDVRKHGPAWVRTLVVDARTLEPVPPGRPGFLRHFDLANRGSVMVIQTEDRAVARPDPVKSAQPSRGGGLAEGSGPASGSGPADWGRMPFELLGRALGSEPRGCSLEAESVP